MKLYKTVIHAVDPKTGDLTVFEGPPIMAWDKQQADEACIRIFPYAEVLQEENESAILKALLA